MAAYPVDLRERIVEAAERQSGSKRKSAALFGVREAFLYKLLRRKRERGDIAPLPHGGGQVRDSLKSICGSCPPWSRRRRTPPSPKLRAQLEKKARVAVSLSTPCRGLQALGLSRKKSLSAPPKRTPKSAPRSKSNKRRWQWRT